MKSIHLITVVLVASLSSCGNGANTNSGSNSDSARAKTSIAKEPTQSKLSETGTNKLITVLGKYYALKNALVATKAPDAGTTANGLLAATDSMLSFLKTDSINGKNLQPYLDTIVTQCKVIASFYDESCEKQRLAFGTISSAFYGLLKNADLKNGHVYHEYCPMAFNDKGAFWLSDESEIKNPYFGKKMMECGEVIDSL
jgi:Cu(I)/Ag(I) efflux system membrane fusion protein